MSKKVFVGLSGGVDSSVSAAILKEKGFDVTGVFIKVWYPEFLPCDWRSEMRDAMRVCAKLKIPFKCLDLEKEYKESVIDYMISEYAAGRTPNPDVMCNKHIKFGSFAKYAFLNGADFLATGHYAISKNNDLYEAKDKEKDQSYFLWGMNKEIISKIIFPVGEIKKSETRKYAKKFNLHTSQKKDSQGLCFLGHVDMKDFIRKFVKTNEGDVIDEKGEKIGHHNGSILYTIGESQGFTITKKELQGVKMYVVDKNVLKNTITTSTEPLKNKSNVLVLNNLNLFCENLPKEFEIRTRYRQEKRKVFISKIEFPKIYLEDFNRKESVAIGQSAVFYDGEKCLGGGIIEEA